jgi:hypothetical protein
MNPHWNVFDYWDDQTKLIHYTDLYRQPWKYPNHPYGELWFEYFNEAVTAGYITQQDIELSIIRAYVRPNMLEGNFSRKGHLEQRIKSIRKTLQPLKKLLKQSSLIPG